MGTTIEDIRRWIKNAPKGAIYLFVICDTFDWEDYPTYAWSVDDARRKKSEYPRDMQKIMEIYDLRKDIEKQLNTRFNMAEIK